MSHLRPCLVITGTLLALTCVVYPAAVTATARAVFAPEAEGSLLRRGDVVVGSSLIGQTFAKPVDYPGYFWGRASAAAVDSASGIVTSSGSNLGPRSATLSDEVKERVAMVRATGVEGAVPADLVTKSGSGLDPHISPRAALIQATRVAAARGLPLAEVEALAVRHTEGPTLGFIGDARVNVLELNLALDRLTNAPVRPSGSAPEVRP